MNKNKVIIFAIVGILLASSFTVAVNFAAAMPTNMADTVANRLMSASWIRLNGVITQWGTIDVRGTLQTQARAATHQISGFNHLTSATAIWTTNITREISAAQSKENFTYVYFVARLPNASISAANVDSASVYSLSGTWNLANITSTITVITDENGGVIKVHREQDITPGKAYGELTVTGNTFTLNINGIEPLTGSVFRSITRSWYNPFKMTDDSTTSAVTRDDIKAIAQNYGAMPGWGNYNVNMDFNHNYRVDIADISSVARNI
jgi:hypothetical protein